MLKNLRKTLTTRPTHGYTDILPKRSMWAEVAESVGGEFKLVFTKSHDIEIHRITISLAIIRIRKQENQRS